MVRVLGLGLKVRVLEACEVRVLYLGMRGDSPSS